MDTYVTCSSVCMLQLDRHICGSCQESPRLVMEIQPLQAIYHLLLVPYLEADPYTLWIAKSCNRLDSPSSTYNTSFELSDSF